MNVQVVLDLKQALAWIMQGGGGLVIAYWIIEQWPWAVALDPKPRQWAAWVISAAIGVGVLGLSMWLRYQQIPTTGQEWFQAIALAISLAISGASLKHTQKDLGKFTRNPRGERILKRPQPKLP